MKYISRKNKEKLIFLDVHGGSATIQTRSKSRLTNGFNILKVNKNILYILSMVLEDDEEMYKIYKIKSSKELLSSLDTSLAGYDEEKLYSIIGREKELKPCSMSNSLNAILSSFAILPGVCDVVVKRVIDDSQKTITKLFPLVSEERNRFGDIYYPYSGGNYRDILEFAIREGEVVEVKEGNYSNIRNRKKIN